MQTHINRQTVTHILFNHHNIIQPVETIAEGNKSNKRLYFPPSTPCVFLFSLLQQLLERMQRQERQTYWMINYRGRHFPCQQYELYSSLLVSLWFAFLCLYFPHLWTKKENRVGNCEALMCSEDRVLSKK